MPYIGTDINYGNLAKQTGTGDGADTTPIAALTYTVPSSESILVFLDGVCQVPSTDFTASGTTLTFTTAPANGVAILVMFLGRSLDIGTPADNTVSNAKMTANSVDSDQYVDGSIDEAHIATDAVNFATHLKAGTDGELITWDASGNPAAVPVGTATHVLTSNGAGAAPTFQAASGGDLRNFIIDGAGFTQWPGGTTISCPINTNTYGGGLWRVMSSNSAAVVSIMRGTDVPTVAQSGYQSAYSLDIDYTTADSALGSHDILGVDYVVTGSDYAHLHGAQQVTLAFWIKATVTGTSCVYFINSGHNRSYVAEFTISSTNTWEYKTITLTTDNTGTWLFTEADKGLVVGFALSHIGSTYHATNETWTGTAQKHSTSNQVNHASSTSNIFRIAQVGLYKGSSAPSSVLSPPVSTVHDQVSYYVYTTYSRFVNIGSNSPAGQHQWQSHAADQKSYTTHSFPTSMRITPTVTFYTPVNGNSGKCADNDTGTEYTCAASQTNMHSVGIGPTANLVAGNKYGVHIFANARH